MNRKCHNCNLVNFADEEICRRCGAPLAGFARHGMVDAPEMDLGKRLDAGAIWFFKRLATALAMSFILLVFTYLTMIYSATQLTAAQQKQVDEAIAILDERGFKDDARWLRWSVYRSNDNWFNALTKNADAYAATNFPFEIITLYEVFFSKTTDSTERAVILLHEAQHLKGYGEPHAYAYVWRNRHKLGWTRQNYGETRVYQNVYKSTKHYSPFIFRCAGNTDNDCTE
jgi:RNA polymerase subunit RPABC4/transcription elongation factor Spt4